MKNVLKYGCLGIMGLVGLLAGMLLFLAWRAEPLPTTAEAMTTLPAVELAALKQICAKAKVDPVTLRNIGDYEGGIFNHELNQRSVVIRNGHVVGLCLRRTPFTGMPDFSELSDLVALDLQDCSLQQWPDLSQLTSLKQVDLSRQPLPDADAAKLPPKVKTLHLEGTSITDCAPFAKLSQLTELDLSGTAVTSFEPLLGLSLDALNLERTKVATLPATIPTHGAWELNLDATPALERPGYSLKWPFPGWITGTPNSSDTATGALGKAKVDVTGTVSATSKLRSVHLPRVTDPQVPPVILEVTCTGGKARVWLEEPPGYFASPWMQQRKVKGFGLLRGRGYVSQELAPGKTVTLHGSLRLDTQDRIYEMAPEHRSQSMKPDDWCNYSFYLEPLDGSTVSGISYTVRAAP